MDVLLKKHRVEILISGKFNFFWATADKTYMPKINYVLAGWIVDQIKKAQLNNGKLKQLAKDLLPLRVGVHQAGNALYAFPISWAQFLQMSDPSLKDMLETESFSTLGVSCLIETADKKFLLGFRSKNVCQYAEHFFVSAGGYVDCSKIKKYSPVAQVKKEIKEEVGLKRSEYGEIITLGVCRHSNGANIDALYYIKTAVNSVDILKKAALAKDSWEGKLSAYTLPDMIKILENEKMDPSAAAAIVLTLNRLKH